MFEHIIELNTKIDRLTAKHKKLKKKYNTIRNDIYADEDDIVEPSPLTKFVEDNTPKTLSNDLTESNFSSENGEGEHPNNSTLANFSAENIPEKSLKTHSQTVQRTIGQRPTNSLYTPTINQHFANHRSNWRSQVKYL